MALIRRQEPGSLSLGQESRREELFVAADWFRSLAAWNGQNLRSVVIGIGEE